MQQSSGTDSFGSMPTLDSEFSASSSDNNSKNAASKTDIELNTTAQVHSTLTSGYVYVAGRKRKWTIPHKCDCLFKKTCIVYTLILAAIWILNTIPIIVFYATSATVCYLKSYNNIENYDKSILTIDYQCYCKRQ